VELHQQAAEELEACLQAWGVNAEVGVWCMLIECRARMGLLLQQ
jgi:hypothetical protein